MVRPIPSSLHDQSATLRQLKFLVVVLVISNIGLGVFSFYLLRSMDRAYSDLIDRSMPLLNNLQALTARSVQGMRGTSAVFLKKDGTQFQDQLNEAYARLREEEAVRLAVLKTASGESSPWLQFKAAGTAFSQTAREVLSMHGSGRSAEALRLRDETLMPAFEKYVDATRTVAVFVEAQSQRDSDSVSARTGTWSNLVLGVASWPVVVLAGLLLLTAVFVLVLMVLFRGREMSDMP
jgi:hypothetical protein